MTCVPVYFTGVVLSHLDFRSAWQFGQLLSIKPSHQLRMYRTTIATITITHMLSTAITNANIKPGTSSPKPSRRFESESNTQLICAAGSWTRLHRDVLCSYSWSANVCGSKRSIHSLEHCCQAQTFLEEWPQIAHIVISVLLTSTNSIATRSRTLAPLHWPLPNTSSVFVYLP